MTKKIITLISTAMLVLAFAASCMAKESFKLSGTYEEYLEKPQRFIVVDSNFLKQHKQQTMALITSDPIKILGLDVKIAEFYFSKDKDNGKTKMTNAIFELENTNSFEKAIKKVKAAPVFKNAIFKDNDTPTDLITKEKREFSIYDKDIGISAIVSRETYKNWKTEKLYLKIKTNGETELDQVPKGEIKGQRNYYDLKWEATLQLAKIMQQVSSQQKNTQAQTSKAS